MTDETQQVRAKAQQILADSAWTKRMVVGGITAYRLLDNPVIADDAARDHARTVLMVGMINPADAHRRAAMGE